jgi:hypothetical protein
MRGRQQGRRSVLVLDDNPIDVIKNTRKISADGRVVRL